MLLMILLFLIFHTNRVKKWSAPWENTLVATHVQPKFLTHVKRMITPKPESQHIYKITNLKVNIFPRLSLLLSRQKRSKDYCIMIIKIVL